MGGRSAYPGLKGTAAKLAIAVDAAIEAKFEATFDERQRERVESAAAAMKRAASLSPEQRRVRDILARDRADKAAEEFRREAEIEVEAGRTVYMADAVVPPTPEQLATGEFLPYTPRQPDGTVREVRTHRRIQAYQAHRMLLWGVIDHQGYADCKWYAALHEATGLAGSVKSIDYGREVFSAPHNRSMFTEWQIDKQDEFRFVRRLIPSRHLRLLDQIVLHDVPIHSAVRVARAFHRTPKIGFAQAVDHLHTARRRLRTG